jgi:hypothetical protein
MAFSFGERRVGKPPRGESCNFETRVDALEPYTESSGYDHSRPGEAAGCANLTTTAM